MATDTVVTEDKGMILNGWERSGGCHENCGACCKHLILPLDPAYLAQASGDWIRWVGAHGIKVKGRKAHIPLRCAYLMWDNQCSVHGTEEQPRMCAEGPRLPSEITGLEEVCTYRWKRAT